MNEAAMTVAEDMREDEIVMAHRAMAIARRIAKQGGAADYMHGVAAEYVAAARRYDDFGRRT